MKKNSIKKYYDNYGTWYDDERIEGYYSFINKLETDIVKKYGKGKKLLEVGCGTGIILNETAKFADVRGIDLSSGMLEKAKAKKLTVSQASAIDLPFENSSFDVVYSFKVLAHIPDIKKALSEMSRVCKKNGFIIAEFYNPYSWKRLTNLVGRIFRKGNNKVYIRFDSRKKVNTLIGNDLQLIDSYGIRIFTPTKFFLQIPLINSALAGLEKRYFNKKIFKEFGGYYVYVWKKQ